MTNQKRVRKTPEERRADVHGAARSIARESGLSAVTQRAVAAIDDGRGIERGARYVVGATDGLSAQSAVWAGYADETAR